MTARILIVDDDPAIRELVTGILQKAGFHVTALDAAEEGLKELRTTLYDALVLDVSLPGISGIKMCEILKQDPATAGLPVIMLTAHGTERDKVQGLEMGADDYIVKPPPSAELVARLQALLRRVKYGGVPEKILEWSGLRLDLDRHEVTVKGKLVSLRPKEYRILVLLLEKRGKVLPRNVLFDDLWPDQVVTEHTLEVHINNLRDRIGPFAQCIQTVSGVGYKFDEKKIA